MIGRTTAAGVAFALLVGCTQPAQTQSQALPPAPPPPQPVTDPCAQIADEAIAQINAYLAEAGPSIQHAPRMAGGDLRLNPESLRAAGCTEKEYFDLLAERAPQVQGEDKLARYVKTLLVAMAHPEDGEVLAWLLAFGPPSWIRGKGGLTSRNVEVDRTTWRPPHEQRIERVMRKPPKIRIPGPAYPPPLPPPDWED